MVVEVEWGSKPGWIVSISGQVLPIRMLQCVNLTHLVRCFVVLLNLNRYRSTTELHILYYVQISLCSGPLANAPG
jgi:hypothetical protein